MSSNLTTSICALCVTILMMPGCHIRSFSEARSIDTVPGNLHSPTPSPDDFIASGLFDNNPQALKVWRAFLADGKYRVADASDFKFSEAAKNKLRGMFEAQWYARIKHPAITGNINRRSGFKDLAVIVVDSTKHDANRFGVVIFNIDEAKGLSSQHWLVQNRDLSSALLSWYSNWPVLVFYRDNGSSDPYYINWNDKARTYSLDKRQIGPDARDATLVSP